MTLREALAEILTPAIVAERVEREQLEAEYVVAEALFQIRRQGRQDCPAAQAIVAWCRRHASVWRIEDGDRRLEAPPADAGEAR